MDSSSFIGRLVRSRRPRGRLFEFGQGPLEWSRDRSIHPPRLPRVSQRSRAGRSPVLSAGRKKQVFPGYPSGRVPVLGRARGRRNGRPEKGADEANGGLSACPAKPRRERKWSSGGQSRRQSSLPACSQHLRTKGPSTSSSGGLVRRRRAMGRKGSRKPVRGGIAAGDKWPFGHPSPEFGAASEGNAPGRGGREAVAPRRRGPVRHRGVRPALPSAREADADAEFPWQPPRDATRPGDLVGTPGPVMPYGSSANSRGRSVLTVRTARPRLRPPVAAYRGDAGGRGWRRPLRARPKKRSGAAVPYRAETARLAAPFLFPRRPPAAPPPAPLLRGGSIFGPPRRGAHLRTAGIPFLRTVSIASASPPAGSLATPRNATPAPVVSSVSSPSSVRRMMSSIERPGTSTLAIHRPSAV